LQASLQNKVDRKLFSRWSEAKNNWSVTNEKAGVNRIANLKKEGNL
jgi:hypothetical protein